MIHLTLFIPLIASGATLAIWRERKQKKALQKNTFLLENTENHEALLDSEKSTIINQFDDMTELSHYQRTSFYALAFSTAGSWFYPPVAFLAIPLAGYNSYHFIKTLKHTETSDQTSPLTVFEAIGVGGTLLTGHTGLGSLVLASSFTMRKLLLQGSHIASAGSDYLLNMKHAHTWVLREGVEVEMLVSELQKGDVFVLHSGDLALVEGKIIDGKGVIRQYSLKREMKSIYKGVGDTVFPFTRVEKGCLYVRP
jgi:cation transport ATPase